MITSCPAGEYSVLDERSLTLQARFRSQKGDTVVLALSPDRYIVKQVQDDRLMVASVDMTWGGDKQITAKSLKPFPADAFLKKGSPMVYRGHGIALSCGIMQGLPSGRWTIPHLSYTYSFYNKNLELGVGYAQDGLYSQSTAIERKLLDVNATFNYYLINKARFAVSVGPRVDYFYLVQRPRRNGECQVQALGYERLPEYFGHLLGGFLGGAASLSLPAGFGLGIEAFPGVVFSRDFEHALHADPRVMGGVSLVKLF
jgi:hypothetical protein